MNSEPSHPSLDEIIVVLAHLANRAAAERGRNLDPIIGLSLDRAMTELKRHIPGLHEPPDRGAAAHLASASANALRRGKVRAALGRALRGLSFSPHHPDLWYLAGSACLQLGSAEIAIRLLQHSLWIHPRYRPALQDLESLAPFYDVQMEFHVEMDDEPQPHLHADSDYADDPYYSDEEDEEEDL